MGEKSKGFAAIIAAALIWGLAPIYYKQLVHVPPMEVLAHRTFWSFVTFGSLLLLQGRVGELRTALNNWRALRVIAVAGVTISINWFFFILAIQIEWAIDASLGYFIYPLVSVAIGFVIYGERLAWAQWMAMAMAVIAVFVLALGLGVTPWISLLLASSFSVYGAIKKTLDLGPVVSVTAEVLLVLPLALLWLWGVHFAGWTGVSGRAGC